MQYQLDFLGKNKSFNQSYVQGKLLINLEMLSILTGIFLATSAVQPRADVAYCIHALSRRISKTKNWIVTSSFILYLNDFLLIYYDFYMMSLSVFLSFHVYYLYAQVALKTLIVIHRTLREGDTTFREELLNYLPRGHILQMTYFKDDSSPLGMGLLQLHS